MKLSHPKSLIISTALSVGLSVISVPVFGQSIQDAIRLNNEALQLYNQGRLTEATARLRSSLAIVERVPGANGTWATIASLLATVYKEQGHYSDAEPLYKRSLEIAVKLLGSDALPVAELTNNLARLYNEQGRYSDAEKLYKRALAIKEKVLDSNDPQVAALLNNIAQLYVSQGKYAEAEALFSRALKIYEKTPGDQYDRDLAAMLGNMGGLSAALGRYEAARQLFNRALAVEQKIFGPDHPEVAATLNNLASINVSQGRYDEAEPLLKRSLVINERSYGLSHPKVSAPLENLAQLYRFQGRYLDAEPLYKRSLAILENTLEPQHLSIAAALQNLAALYVTQGRFDDAEPYYQRSIVIREKALGSDHPDFAKSLFGLATFYEQQGRYRDAEPLYRRSLRIREKILGSDHPEVGVSLNGLAYCYASQGRYAEAEPLYQKSLEIREKTLGPNHPDVALSLNNLAALYNAQGHYAEAMPFVKRTIAARRASGMIAFAVLSGSEKSGLIGQEEALAASYNVLQFSSSSKAAEAVVKVAQRFAAGGGELATMVRKQQDLSVEADNLDKALLAAASKGSKERNISAEESMRKRLAEIDADLVRIESVLAKKFPNYVALAVPQPLTIDDTQNLLADDEAVVALIAEPDANYAWVVTKTDAFWTRTPINDFHTEVARLRQSLKFEENGEAVDKPFDVALSYKIYQHTLAPVADKLAGKKRLFIIANGAMTSLPFGLLVTKDPSRKSLKETEWLIKSHAITVSPSIYSLKTMRTQGNNSSAPKPMIAFADPIFSKSARAQAKSAQNVAMRSLASFYEGTYLDVGRLGENLRQLPGTRDEVESIGEALGVGSTDLNLGLVATETAVKKAKLDEYRIVYFATHGLVAGDLAKFSKAKAEPALALTIPDKPTEFDDGLLQASEVAQLKLNADWAVLSACNTASADGVGAEALSGLARAFLYAGARSLVVSHWDVSDEATKALMTNLFEISAKSPSLSHGEAMQQATLKLINEAKTEEEAHPKYWAPFVVVGEPAKM
jgi:CHAT domain-containing protein